METRANDPYTISTSNTHVSLVPDKPLDILSLLSSAKSPSAGAVVMFAGTTRSFSRREGCCSPGENHVNASMRSKEERELAVRKRRRVDGDQQSKGANSPRELPGGYENITSLTYHSYAPLALRSMQSIARTALERWGGDASKLPGKDGRTDGRDQHVEPRDGTVNGITAGEKGANGAKGEDEKGLEKVVISHRLGEVPVGEESVFVCVSAAHRGSAWRAGEWCLEEVKKRVEIWKWEEFVGGGVLDESEDGRNGMWRSNAVDSAMREEVG